MMVKFNPLYHPAIFTKPVRRSSIWDTTPFLPFFAYVASAIQPRNYYEVGVLLGESFSFMCQVSGDSDRRFECTGIDIFEQGDPDCDGVYGHLRNQHGIDDLHKYLSSMFSQYSRFARLEKCDSRKFADTVAEESVDFLFIDGDHSYKGVKADFEAWLPKISSKGVVVFHDTHALNNIENVGVQDFFKEISAQYPYFSLDFGAGVGLIAVGEDINPEIASLCDKANPDLPLIQKFFKRVGAMQMEVVHPTYTKILPKANVPYGYAEQ